MNEADWLTCSDPAPMLDFLRGKASERKLGLFVGACCREVLGASTEETTRLALALVEQLADGQVVAKKRERVRYSAGQAVINCGASEPLEPLVLSSPRGPIRVDPSALDPLLGSVLDRLICWGPSTWQSQLLVWRFTRAGLAPACQAQLLRDVVRGMFRPLFFRAAWRTWNDGVTTHIARKVYNEATFDALPILADALEDAGCDCDEILTHLRGPGPHVRGCWVVDLLLGKG
jgi:hypothetical protein